MIRNNVDKAKVNKQPNALTLYSLHMTAYNGIVWFH